MNATLSQLAQGLRYVPDFIESDAQARLLADADAQPWQDVGGQRRIQFYGHIDAPIFEDVIVAITLGSTCIMELTQQGQENEQLLLEPGSALVLSAEARQRWQHSIPAREADVWMERTLHRSRRVSMTFRKVRGTSASVGIAP